MDKFNINNFLKNHVPKKINIKPYMMLEELEGYKLWSKNKRIYDGAHVKYVKNTDIVETYEQCIVDEGGIFVGGGYYTHGDFIVDDDVTSWTHIKLETNISKKSKTVQKKYSYIIKLANYLVFYDNTNITGKNDTRNIMVQLLQMLN